MKRLSKTSLFDVLGSFSCETPKALIVIALAHEGEFRAVRI